MRIMRPVLAAVITLSLVAGYDSVQTKKNRISYGKDGRKNEE